MDKQQLDAEVRIVALESLTGLLYNVVMTLTKFTPDEISALEKQLLDSAAQATISRLDPAMSDHVSDEARSALVRLLENARKMR